MKTDAHAHFYDLEGKEPDFLRGYVAAGGLACVSHHSRHEIEASERYLASGARFLLSFGIHPQCPEWEEADYLSGLLEAGRLDAVGECGFDFYEGRTEEAERVQEDLFGYHLELAARYEKPLLIHLRKAMDALFRHAPALKKLPSVILHSYPGSEREARSLIERGVNAYFSFGAPLRNGNKRARESAALLPSERILVETDAPYQPPRGYPFCRMEHIDIVLAALAELRGISVKEAEALTEGNFLAAFRFVR